MVLPLKRVFANVTPGGVKGQSKSAGWRNEKRT